MANTEYSFQIRGVFGDQEGQYGPINDDIRTKQSLATTLLDFTVLLDDSTSPSKYQLPVEENKNARNENARTRQLILGSNLIYLHTQRHAQLINIIHLFIFNDSYCCSETLAEINNAEYTFNQSNYK